MNRTVRKGVFDEARKIYVVYLNTWELYCVLILPCVEYIYFFMSVIRSKFSSGSLVNFRVVNIIKIQLCCQLRVKFKFKHQRGNHNYSRSSLSMADFISRCLWARIKKYSSWICESRHLSGYNIGFDFDSFVSILCQIYLSHGIKNISNAPLLLMWSTRIWILTRLI